MPCAAYHLGVLGWLWLVLLRLVLVLVRLLLVLILDRKELDRRELGGRGVGLILDGRDVGGVSYPVSQQCCKGADAHMCRSNSQGRDGKLHKV
jgi:hypothetical protein